MLGTVHLVLHYSASGHNLSALMTIEIERSAFEAGDTWQKSEDRTLGSTSDQSDWRVRSPRFFREQIANGSIRGGSLFKPHGRLKLTLLAICIDIATL